MLTTRFAGLLTAIFIILSSSAYANEYVSPVTVTETEHTINIKSDVCYIGMNKNKNVFRPCHEEHISEPELTYKEAFEIGVKQMWEGTYKGKDVTVILNEVDAEADIPKITVECCSVSDEYGCPYALKSESYISLCSGDTRTNTTYTYHEIINYVAGHEFAHILGLADCYNDKDINMRKLIKSPMNSVTVHKAQVVDYYIMLHYRTWESPAVFQYHDAGLALYL